MRLVVVLLVAGLALASCKVPKLDPSAETMAKAAFDEIRRGDMPALTSQLAPNLKSPDSTAKLTQLKQMIPDGTARGRRTVGWHWFEQASGETTVDVTDEYDFGDRKVLWNTHLHRVAAAAPWEIQGVQLTNSTVRALAANEFSLTGKTPPQYLFLMTTALSPMLMIVALVKVIRTVGLRRKWLWGIAAFFGLGSVQMNWTTGQMAANWATVQFIGAGATRGDSSFVAWVLTMTIPIGALLILTGLWANPARARAPRPLDP
jgi:hypothetical protein